MAQFFQVHPENPQARLCKQAAALLDNGAIAAIPTDSCYALVCRPDHRQALERLRQIKSLSEKHHLALLCKDLAELGHYAKVDNTQYRLLKAIFPGPYTFILEATREVPRRVSHPSKKTIGLRVPNHPVVQGILAHLDGPLVSSTLQLPDMHEPCRDGEQVRALLEKELDLIVCDGQDCGIQPTTVIDWSQSEPVVIRVGLGPLEGPLQPLEIDERQEDEDGR